MYREYKQMVDDSTPGMFEAEGPMTAYVWDMLLDGDFGDDEVGFGNCDGANRYGKRILFCDSVGFVSLKKYASVSDAEQAMDALHGQFDDSFEEAEFGQLQFQLEAAQG